MRLFFVLLISLILSNCSFDKKSGIWKNENNVNLKKDKKIFKDFKEINTSSKKFNETVQLKKNFKFNLERPISNNSWNDIFYNKYNNLKNFNLKNSNQISFKSKKLTRHKVNPNTLFENNNFILSDNNGNVIVYSLELEDKIVKFNFYKKKYKNIKKSLNLIVENGVIYISDNIGYIYAYNYITKQILWAKNFKTPFRSNIKLIQNNLVTSNQNNVLFIIDKLKGNLVKQVPSERTIINNSFKNNIALGDKEILYLNTYGSLYSIENKNFKLKWFINLNNSFDSGLNNLFFGTNLVYFKNKIFVSSNDSFYILDSKTGANLHKKNFSSFLRPILNNNYIFFITKNNFLLAIDVQSGDIIYSYNIAQKISKFNNSKNIKINIKNFFLINNKIIIYLKNSKIIQFDVNGEIERIYKIPSKLNSSPIFINDTKMYINNQNRLLIIN